MAPGYRPPVAGPAAQGIPRAFVITLDREGARTCAAQKRFADMGLSVQPFYGFDGVRAALSATHIYMYDNPAENYRIGPKIVGIYVSHLMLWSALELLDDPGPFLIFEDDAIALPGWRPRLERALKDVPADFDVLYAGSCCAMDKPRELVRGEVWDLRYPQCLHAYVLARKAIPHLRAGLAKVSSPVDIAMVMDAFTALRVYTVIPRIFDQANTEFPD